MHCAARSEVSPDRSDQRFVIDIAGSKTRHAAGRSDEFKRHRLYRNGCRNGGLGQIGVKRFEGDAITRRAFGEHRQDIARTQQLSHLRHHPAGITPRLALKMQRTGAVGQSAEKGPVPDVGL